MPFPLISSEVGLPPSIIHPGPKGSSHSSVLSLLQTVPRPAWAAWGRARAAVRNVALATSRWAPSVSVSLLLLGHRRSGVFCPP